MFEVFLLRAVAIFNQCEHFMVELRQRQCMDFVAAVPIGRVGLACDFFMKHMADEFEMRVGMGDDAEGVSGE